jgi:hypothetical protein
MGRPWPLETRSLAANLFAGLFGFLWRGFLALRVILGFGFGKTFFERFVRKDQFGFLGIVFGPVDLGDAFITAEVNFGLANLYLLCLVDVLAAQGAFGLNELFRLDQLLIGGDRVLGGILFKTGFALVTAEIDFRVAIRCGLVFRHVFLGHDAAFNALQGIVSLLGGIVLRRHE